MLRKIVTAIVIIPLAILLLAFAVANRQTVTVIFDPFDTAHPAYALTLPLFAMVFVLMILGVIVGGVAAWLRQSHWRRAARRLDGEVHALQGDVAALRAQLAATEMPAASLEPERVLIPPPMVP
ncbi:MAG: lipopolysaccharide assembly protein LapA domain-containing protein [Pseudolabrys sp.]